MRVIIYLLIALFVAVAIAFYIHSAVMSEMDPGYVLIGYGHWSLETSLLLLVAVLALGFITFYVLLRLSAGVIRLPQRIMKRGLDLKSSRSQKALLTGLIDSAEGNWEKAEKSLIRHAADSGIPLMNYLTAARAAQSRGAYEKRDEYLKLAHESTPGSELAVGLIQAELHLSNKEFEDALNSLTRLKSIAPGHASVLGLLHQTYAHLEDWEAIRSLIPALHKNKVMMEAELKLLETETYSALIKQEAERGDQASLKALWESVPPHVQAMPGVNSMYFAAMIELEAGAEIEPLLRGELEKNWNETLIVLYGYIHSSDPGQQLALAEGWLAEHPKDAVLLRTLGRVSLNNQDFDKAEKYLGASVALEPSVDAYLLLGDMLAERDDPVRANSCYRRGLLLASDEVVKQVENISFDLEEEAQAAVPALEHQGSAG